jgi:hypothetical protein
LDGVAVSTYVQHCLSCRKRSDSSPVAGSTKEIVNNAVPRRNLRCRRCPPTTGSRDKQMVLVALDFRLGGIAYAGTGGLLSHQDH